MKRAAPFLLAVALTVLSLGCDARTPTQPLEAGPAFAISDAAHGGEVAGFYFLPPMVPQPATTGAFMGSLSPVVRICRWLDAPGTCGGVEHEFTMTTGPGGQKLVVENGQHYQLNLDTKIPELALETGELYRITVVLNGVPLGWADVQLEANGSAFKNLQTEDVIGLVDGRTLPVKFRIEYGALNALDFQIAYHSNRDADPACPYNMDVYLYDRGRNLSVNLTNSPNTIDGTPSWNPQDRNQIAFASDRAQPGACAHPDVYVMDLTTGSVQRLTTEGGWKPAWSPDGSKIAFQRGWPPDCDNDVPTDPCRQHDIWVMNADGSGQTQLTDVGHAAGQDPYEDHDPTWNTNNLSFVTFARSHNVTDASPSCSHDDYNPLLPLNTCNFDIVSVNVNYPHAGLNHSHALFPAFDFDPEDLDQLSPAWSHEPSTTPPNKLIFSVGVSENQSELGGIFNNPGYPPRVPVQLTSSGTTNEEPDWSWDNAEILFTQSGGLFTLQVPGEPIPGQMWPQPVPLLANAMWGRYRPPIQP